MRIYHPQVCTGSASPSLPGLAVSATQDLVNSQMGNGEKIPKKSHQSSRIKLGHNVVQERSQVSWAGFQELDVLEAAALPIDLQENRELHLSYSRIKKTQGITSQLFRNKRKDSKNNSE